MMGFLLLTLSFSVAILLAGVIATVVIFTLMGNEKFIKLFMRFYKKQIDQSVKAFEDVDFEEMGV